MGMPTRPILRGVAPETPNFGGAQGDFTPVTANEQEVPRSFFQVVQVVLEDDVPSEDIAEYFGWELGNV